MSRPDEGVLRIEVKPTLADFTAANRLVYINSNIFDAVFRHAVVIASFYFLMMNATDFAHGSVSLSGTSRHLLIALLVAPFLALFTVTVFWCVMPLIARRAFAKQRIVGERTVYSFSSEVVQAKGESFESAIDWSVARDFLQTRAALLIRVSKTGFFLLSKSQIEDSFLTAISALLKDNQVKGPFPR